PAWASMATGVTPGELGLYGFRQRSAFDYTSRRLASSLLPHQPIWQFLSDAGLRNLVNAVPQTYPAVPLNGLMLTGCLTPGEDGYHCYPPELGQSVNQQFGPIRFDVPEFRHLPRVELLDEIYAFSKQRFAITH